MNKSVLPVRIYYEDTDSGGVVYYANYLKFAERARTEWLRSLGFSQRILWDTHKCGFVVKRCEVDYRQPAFLDDMVQVESSITKMGASYFILLQEVMRDGVLIASLTVSIVCVSTSFRPMRMPGDVYHAIAGAQ